MDKDLKLDKLIEACGYGLLEPAKRLVEDGVNVNGYQNNLTPLIASIYGQNIELTEFLIKSGALINQGMHTVMHEAFDCILENMIAENLEKPDIDEFKIIEFLINEGGDVEKRNEVGESPLEAISRYASDNKSFERLKRIFRPIIPDIDKRIQFKKKQ